MVATGPIQALARPSRRLAADTTPVLAKFLSDRGPHLAAMVAYYALLSLVPFLFVLLSLLGLAGRPSETSYLVREIQHIIPGQSAASIIGLVEDVQGSAGTIGVLGLLGIAWASLGFYSALESALNIVFQVPNRPFLAGKGLTFVLVLASLVGLFAALVVATAATSWVNRHVADGELVDLSAWSFAASLAVTTISTFVFLLAVFRFLPNADVRTSDILPGAIVGTVAFQLSFSALPLYLRFSDGFVALRAFGGLVILLVWLYLMANILVLCAEINWRHWRRRHAARADEQAPGLA